MVADFHIGDRDVGMPLDGLGVLSLSNGETDAHHLHRSGLVKTTRLHPQPVTLGTMSSAISPPSKPQPPRLMKKLTFVLSSLILTGLTLGNLTAGQPALIKIDPDRTVGAIDPNIYSSFLEPVGRDVVYGSLYDPSSPLADSNGFRKEARRSRVILPAPLR